MEKMIETQRLVIRKFKEDDAQALYENHLDDQVRKWFPNECYADLAEAQDAIRFYADCVDNGHLPFVLGVELKETGELIGDTGINEVEGKQLTGTADPDGIIAVIRREYPALKTVLTLGGDGALCCTSRPPTCRPCSPIPGSQRCWQDAAASSGFREKSR